MPGIDAYTKLLLHCDGADGSTSFPDSSFNLKTVTAVNSAQVDTAQVKFGTGSAFFDSATADYLTSADNADYEFGSGNFTVDFWVRFATVDTPMVFVSKYATATPQRSWFFSWDQPTANMFFRYSEDGSASTLLQQAWSPVTNTWYHLAVVRSDSNLLMFVDGSQIGSTDTITGALFDGEAPLQIGTFNDGTGGPMDGWMDEIRISNGVARWTSNFTPPTQAYTPDVTDNPVARVIHNRRTSW